MHIFSSIFVCTFLVHIHFDLTAHTRVIVIRIPVCVYVCVPARFSYDVQKEGMAHTVSHGSAVEE